MNHHRLVRIVYVPEDAIAVVAERPGHDDAGDVRSWAAPPLPTTHRLRIGLGTGHVSQRDLQPALEGPQPIQTLDLHDQLIFRYLDGRHVTPPGHMRTSQNRRPPPRASLTAVVLLELVKWSCGARDPSLSYSLIRWGSVLLVDGRSASSPRWSSQ